MTTSPSAADGSALLQAAGKLHQRARSAKEPAAATVSTASHRHGGSVAEEPAELRRDSTSAPANNNDADSAPAAGTRTPLLTARAIHKHFRHGNTETAVLAGVEMSLYRGELVAMIGPSGCGKSTLLSILCGLIATDSGEIEMAPNLRGHIGYMQQYDSLLPWQTVLENCIMPLRLHTTSAPLEFRRRSEERRAQEAAGRALLRELGLEQYTEHYPHQLSGGMRQKVSCARAIITRPPLLLLDEPFRSLDGITKEEMHDWYQRRVMGGGTDALAGGDREADTRTDGEGGVGDRGAVAAQQDATTAASNQTTTLLVTHDIYEAAKIADRVLICSARPMRICAVIPAPPQATPTTKQASAADVINAHRRNGYSHALTEALRAAMTITS